MIGGDKPAAAPPCAPKAVRKTAVIGSAFLLSATAIVFAPLQIFLTNTMEFGFDLKALAWRLAVLAVIPAVLLAAGLALTSRWHRLHERATVFVFIVGAALWIQGNFMVWNYGPLDGRPINWGVHLGQGFLDASIWLVLLVLGWFCAPWLYRNLIAVGTACLIAIQLITILSFAWRAPAEGQPYWIDRSEPFHFSSNRNVIVVLLDGFQTDVFNDILNRKKALVSPFGGFTYYRNSVSTFPNTFLSVPNLLTAQVYDNSEPLPKFIADAFRAESSLPRALKAHGYEVDLFPLPYVDNVVLRSPETMSNITTHATVPGDQLAYLLDTGLFRCVPHFMKPLVFSNNNWLIGNALRHVKRFAYSDSAAAAAAEGANEADQNWLYDLTFLSDFQKGIKIDRKAPVFKYYHLVGNHEPFRLNEDLHYEAMDATPANMRRQGEACVKIMGRFLETLRQCGIYDKSMIVVIGDHGSVFPADASTAGVGGDPNRAPAETVPPKSLPLVLIKPFGATGDLKISDAPVSLGDLPATVLSAVGLAKVGPDDSMLTVAADSQRVRRHYSLFVDANKLRHVPPFEEYEARGFSWFNGSWRKTGAIFYPTAEGETKDFTEFLGRNNKFFGNPKFYTESAATTPLWYFAAENQDDIRIMFRDRDPHWRDYIGIEIPIAKLKPGREYELSVEIRDPYNDNKFPGRFIQTVYLGNKRIWSHDISGDDFMGWNKVRYRFRASTPETAMKVQVEAAGYIERGYDWGIAAAARVRRPELRLVK
ncbi:LTA synthase family protein [bacterium]|nr:LTA synthase family protein [bacterium]